MATVRNNPDEVFSWYVLVVHFLLPQKQPPSRPCFIDIVVIYLFVLSIPFETSRWMHLSNNIPLSYRYPLSLYTSVLQLYQSLENTKWNCYRYNFLSTRYFLCNTRQGEAKHFRKPNNLEAEGVQLAR